jgi:hypothetical protein
MDSRLRRSPPDRASGSPMDKPGKTRCVSPTLPTRSAAAHKLHSTTATTGMNLIPGKVKPSAAATNLSLFSPEAIQTGTVALL